jgi:hypothetical protein
MDEALWEAARSIRPYLPELIGWTDAAYLDAALEELLNDSTHDEHTESQLRAVLESHQETRDFLEWVRTDPPLYRPLQVLCRLPGYGDAAGASYTGPPGDPGPVPADKSACPHGDYVWYRPEVGVPVPYCPTHHCQLEPA